MSPFNSKVFQNFSYDQGLDSSLVTFHQFDDLDHHLKWNDGGAGLPGVDFSEGFRVPVELYIPGSLFNPVVQAQFSNIILERSFALDIQVFAAHFVGEAEEIKVAGWKVLVDFLFSLGFCQMNSMFGKVLGLLIFVLAATILPVILCVFSASLLFLDCIVDSRIPSPGLFRHLCFLVDLDAFSVALSRIHFSFSQISSVPLPLALLGVVWWKPYGTLILRRQVLIRMEITDQEVMLIGDLLPSDSLNICHMLAEGFIMEHIGVFASPEVKVIRRLGCFFKQVLPLTRLQDMANCSNLLPSVFLVPPAIYWQWASYFRAYKYCQPPRLVSHTGQRSILLQVKILTTSPSFFLMVHRFSEPILRFLSAHMIWHEGRILQPALADLPNPKQYWPRWPHSMLCDCKLILTTPVFNNFRFLSLPGNVM